MPTLAELQTKFVAGLNKKDNDILNYIDTRQHLSAADHLHIYQSSIFGIKQKSLQEIYSVCQKLVGEVFFIAMINQYIPTRESRASDLAKYGEDLPIFIQHYTPADCLPYLPDVARLEWAWHALFTAQEADGIDFQSLANYYAQSPEKIIFILAPSGTLLSSPYPVHRIWEVNQDDYEGDEMITLPKNEMFYYFIWRQGIQMRIDLLEIDEWTLLNSIKKKLTLDILCKEVCDALPDIRFEELLPRVVSKGWLGGFEISG